MSAPQKWVTGQVWATRPAGLLIFAMSDGVTVESGGRLLIGLRLVRPEALVLLDEAILTLPHQHGYQEAKLTPQAARAWCETAKLVGPDGPVVLNEQLVAAWEHHKLLYREAIARGPGLVVAALVS